MGSTNLDDIADLRTRGLQRAGGELERALGAPDDRREPVWMESVTNLEDAAAAIEKGHVDRKLHPEHMDPLRGHDVRALGGFDVVPSQKPSAAGFARPRPLHTARDDDALRHVDRAEKPRVPRRRIAQTIAAVARVGPHLFTVVSPAPVPDPFEQTGQRIALGRCGLLNSIGSIGRGVGM